MCVNLNGCSLESIAHTGHPSLAHPFLSTLVKTKAFDQVSCMYVFMYVHVLYHQLDRFYALYTYVLLLYIFVILLGRSVA